MKLDGNKIRSGRDRLGYTLRMVGEKSGVSTNTVLRAEHGGEIVHSTARKIAAGLRLEVADLMSEPTRENGSGQE